MKKLKIILFLLIILQSSIIFQFKFSSFSNELTSLVFFFYPGEEVETTRIYFEFEEENSEVYETLIELADTYDVSFYYQETEMEQVYINNVYLYMNDFSSFEESLPFVDYETIDFTATDSDAYYTSFMSDENAKAHMYTLSKEEETTYFLNIYPFSTILDNKNTMSGYYEIFYNEEWQYEAFKSDLLESLEVIIINEFTMSYNQEEMSMSYNETELAFFQQMLMISTLLVLLLFIVVIQKKEKEISIQKLYGFSTPKIIVHNFAKLIQVMVLLSMITFVAMTWIKLDYFNSVSYQFLIEVFNIYLFFYGILCIVLLLTLFYTKFIPISNVIKNMNYKVYLFQMNILLFIFVLYSIVPLLPSLVEEFTNVGSYLCCYTKYQSNLENKAYIESPKWGTDSYFSDNLIGNTKTEEELRLIELFATIWDNKGSFYYQVWSEGEDTHTNQSVNNNYIITSSHYFDENTIYTMNGDVFSVNEEDTYYVLVPQSTLNNSYFSKTAIEETLKYNFNYTFEIEYIEIKDNQYSLNYSITTGSILYTNYFYIVISEKDKQEQKSNIYFSLEEDETLEEVMNPIYEVLDIQGTLFNAYELTNYYQNYVQTTINTWIETIFQLGVSICILCLLAIQNITLYLDIFKKRLAIQYMMGVTNLLKYKDITLITVLKYLTLSMLFLTVGIVNKQVYVICIILLLIEFIVLYAHITIFERRNILTILKGEE